MPLLIQYLMKLSISLSVVWIFYQFVLRRLTFYNWNRLFLLGYSLIAFFIPLINISAVLEINELAENKLIQVIPVIARLATVENEFSINLWDWIFIIFSTGCLVLFARLIIQHLSFRRLRRSAQLLLETPVRLYQVDREIIPFSFAGSIFINRHQHTEEDLKKIIRHEFIHVQQKHSIDMICAEWLCILNWYNPFAWMIRTAIRQNLEFIADKHVVENGIDKKQYQYLLLKVMGAPQYSIASNFNFTSLKKRIAMMNKMKTTSIHLVKFLFVLPLIAVLLLSFRERISRHLKNDSIPVELQRRDTIPARPVSPSKIALPANVSSMASVNNQVTVTLKDGTREQYNLNKSEEKAVFEKKYGSLAKPPVPPQVAISGVEGPDYIMPPVPPAPPLAPPVPPAPPLEPTLPSNVSSININSNKVIIKLKNGKIERYDLDRPDEKASFNKKYGDINLTPPKSPIPPAAPVAVSSQAAISSTVSVSSVVDVSGIPAAEVKPVVSTTVTAAPIVVSVDLVEVRPVIHELPPAEKDEIITEISNQTTSADLALLKKRLVVEGYKLEIHHTKFNNGTLQSLEGIIGDIDSKSRFAAYDFNTIIISKVTYRNGETGFSIRIVNGNSRL